MRSYLESSEFTSPVCPITHPTTTTLGSEQNVPEWKKKTYFKIHHLTDIRVVVTSSGFDWPCQSIEADNLVDWLLEKKINENFLEKYMGTTFSTSAIVYVQTGQWWSVCENKLHKHFLKFLPVLLVIISGLIWVFHRTFESEIT